MACFTPENNAHCLPNVNAFLDTNASLQMISSLSFMSIGLNEDDNFRGARLLAFSVQKVCLDLEIEMFTLRVLAGIQMNFTLC